jgi:hypothetical protein
MLGTESMRPETENIERVRFNGLRVVVTRCAGEKG